jgi:hypothetical protein
MKQSRPVSIIITQILMAFSLVLISLGLTFPFFRALISDPASLLTARAALFFGISFGLTAIFLGFGFVGLCKRRKYGYWLGLFFLAVVNVKNFYTFVGTIRGFLNLGSRKYEGLVILDLSVQSIMISLVFLLFLKVWLGKKEQLFFRESLEGPRLTSTGSGLAAE